MEKEQWEEWFFNIKIFKLNLSFNLTQKSLSGYSFLNASKYSSLFISRSTPPTFWLLKVAGLSEYSSYALIEGNYLLLLQKYMSSALFMKARNLWKLFSKIFIYSYFTSLICKASPLKFGSMGPFTVSKIGLNDFNFSK